MATSGITSLLLYGLRKSPDSSAASASPDTAPDLSMVAASTPSSSEDASTSEQCFTIDGMPPSGPAHYEARRALWLAPPPHRPRSPSPSTSRARLETLLSEEGAVESDDVWKAGLKNVWKGLVSGGRLRRRLPLAIVVKILQAGWLRDGTWPSEDTTLPPSPTIPPLASQDSHSITPTTIGEDAKKVHTSH